MSLDIAVTGISVISGLGEGIDILANARLSGKTIPSKINPELFSEDVSAIHNGPYELHRIQKLFTVVFTRALRMAGTAIAKHNAERIAVFMGNTYGIEEFKVNFFRMYKKSTPSLTTPLLFPYTTANSIAAWLAIQFGLKGINLTFANGSNSVSEAILSGCDSIASGKFDVAIVGGEGLFCDDFADEFYTCGFRQEVVGALILEKKQKVIESGRKIYAVIEDFQHTFLPGRDADALKDAGIHNGIKCVVTHMGNSFAEKLFTSEGEVNHRYNNANVISLDGLFGNTFSASGILGVGISALAVRNEITTGIIKNDSNFQKVLFSNIDSYGGCATMIIS